MQLLSLYRVITLPSPQSNVCRTRNSRVPCLPIWHSVEWVDGSVSGAGGVVHKAWICASSLVHHDTFQMCYIAPPVSHFTLWRSRNALNLSFHRSHPDSTQETPGGYGGGAGDGGGSGGGGGGGAGTKEQLGTMS